MKTICSALFFFIVLNCFSQAKTERAAVIWGDEEKISKKSTLEDIVGSDETGIYVVRIDYKGKNSLFLEHYNNEMNQTKSVELELLQGKKKLDYEKTIYLNNELYVLSSFTNRKLKKKFLFIRKVNKKTLAFTGRLINVSELSFEGKSRFNSGSFSHSISQNEQHLLISYNLPYEKGESERFGLHVYDKDLTEKWSKEVTLPYKEELFSLESFSISDRGNVILLGLLYKEKKEARKRKGKPNYNYHILSYTNNGDTFNEYPIAIEEKFLTDMTVGEDVNQDLVCAGFYSDEGTFSIKGSYFLKINGKTKTIDLKTFKEFGIDFITQNLTERQEKKVKKKEAKGKNIELYEYDLDYLILNEDGGATLVGEQYFVSVHTYTYTDANGNTTTRTTYTYHYNDIIVVSLSPEGEIEWNEKIPKRQSSSNDGGFYLSYSIALVGDNLHFIFNDHIDNLNYSGQGKISYYRGRKDGIVTLVTMDDDGRQVREALFSVAEADIYTRPKVSEQISADELIIYGQRKKSQRFAKVKFNN